MNKNLWIVSVIVVVVVVAGIWFATRSGKNQVATPSSSSSVSPTSGAPTGAFSCDTALTANDITIIMGGVAYTKRLVQSQQNMCLFSFKPVSGDNPHTISVTVAFCGQGGEDPARCASVYAKGTSIRPGAKQLGASGQSVYLAGYDAGSATWSMSSVALLGNNALFVDVGMQTLKNTSETAIATYTRNIVNRVGLNTGVIR